MSQTLVPRAGAFSKSLTLLEPRSSPYPKKEDEEESRERRRRKENLEMGLQNIYRLFCFFLRGERRERNRDRNIHVREKKLSVASHKPPTGGPAYNPGMCPDWDSNW